MLSLSNRIDVLNILDKKESQISIAKHYGVHPNQILRVLKQKDQLMQDW